jgi:membrane protein YdbS with pleckstrin-like domain
MPSPLASILTFSLSAVSKSGLTLTRLFQEGESVPGTTDAILLMGIFIVLIVIIPIVWTHRRWMK